VQTSYHIIAMPLSDLPIEMILDIADRLDDAGMSALARLGRL
jgi:hypothetical protein